MDLASTDVWRWIWLGVGVFFAAGEIAVAGSFFLLPFGIGAFAGSITAFATDSVTASWVVALVVSIAALAVLVPLGRRLDRTSGQSSEQIGANRWEGRHGTVLTEVPGGPGETGLVRVDREEWRAEAVGHDPIPVGAEIAVVRVDGTRLVVEAASTPQS